MQKNESISKQSFIERLANKATAATGSTAAFIVAVLTILIWAVTGPFFHYSETWQLIINTGTTIITFLMIFLIQKSQNKESLAVQLKLNELVASHSFASNRLVYVENMSEEELKVIKKYYTRLKLDPKNDETLQESHSIDEAKKMHELKKDRKKLIEKEVKRDQQSK